MEAQKSLGHRRLTCRSSGAQTTVPTYLGVIQIGGQYGTFNHIKYDCVRFCEVHAVEFVEASDVSISKKREAAQRLYTADKKANALESKAA